MKKSLNLSDLRGKLGLTQTGLATLLDVTSEYVSMMETGKKPLSKKILKKLESIEAGYDNPKKLDPTVRENHASYGCRIPSDCDVPGQLASMRSDMAEMRRQMDGLFALLGSAFRREIQAGSSGDDHGKKAG